MSFGKREKSAILKISGINVLGKRILAQNIMTIF